MLGLSQLSHPESWWTAFSIGLGDESSAKSVEEQQQLLGELTKATERFPVDSHRHSPALLSIWLAYLDLYWYYKSS
jgi:hypothetical protein